MDHDAGPGGAIEDAVRRLADAAAVALTVAARERDPLAQARAYAMIFQVLNDAQIQVVPERGEAILRLRQALQARGPVSLRQLGEMLGLDKPISKVRVWQIIRDAEKRRHDRLGE